MSSVKEISLLSKDEAIDGSGDGQAGGRMPCPETEAEGLFFFEGERRAVELVEFLFSAVTFAEAFSNCPVRVHSRFGPPPRSPFLGFCSKFILI